MTARPSRRGHDWAGLSCGRGCLGASLCFALHDLALRLRHQPQLATASAEQQQRIEVTSSLPEPPVEAVTTMPARPEYPDHLPQHHSFTDAQAADHRLVRGAD